MVLDFNRKKEMHMDNASLLVVAMAEQCRRVIQEWDEYEARLPKALQ